MPIVQSHLLRHQRIQNQLLSTPDQFSSSEAVRHLGAVQSQDFRGAIWALSIRTGESREELLEAFAEGKFLRTHVLRPTWHFVAPTDIRWLLQLTGPRIIQAMGTYNRKLGLDEVIFAKSNAIIESFLSNQNFRTRREIYNHLRDQGIEPGDSIRSSHFLMHAEATGLICSGPWNGKEQTFALIAERAEDTAPLERDEALAELAGRYFASHGPATIKDFTWWSGLTATDCKRAIQICKGLERRLINNEEYFGSTSAEINAKPDILLIPNYDEYTVAYTDRTFLVGDTPLQKIDARDNFLFNNLILWDGQIIGAWRKPAGKRSVTLQLFRTLTSAEQKTLTAKTKQLENF